MQENSKKNRYFQDNGTARSACRTQILMFLM